jgi:hypothetical protein
MRGMIERIASRLGFVPVYEFDLVKHDLYYARRRLEDLDHRYESACQQILWWEGHCNAMEKVVTDVYARMPMPPIVVTKEGGAIE